MKNEKRVLKFHTGRGGRFNNSGHVVFVGFEKITEGATMNNLFPQDDGTYMKESGNECDCLINENGTGYVNEDEDYDATNCVFENELNEKQINAITRIDNHNHFYTSELVEIIKEYYQEYLEEILTAKFFANS